MARGLTRGDVRLARIGASDKVRPVVVLTRGSMIGSLDSVTVAPITSTIRGVPSEVPLDASDGMKAPCAVNLHHVSTVRRDTLGRWVATLRPDRLEQICVALEHALGCRTRSLDTP